MEVRDEVAALRAEAVGVEDVITKAWAATSYEDGDPTSIGTPEERQRAHAQYRADERRAIVDLRFALVHLQRLRNRKDEPR